MSIEEDIAAKIREVDGAHKMSASALSTALVPLVKRAQAEALREAARVFAEGEWADAFMRGEAEDDVSAVQATDRWFNRHADRIEKGAGA